MRVIEQLAQIGAANFLSSFLFPKKGQNGELMEVAVVTSGNALRTMVGSES